MTNHILSDNDNVRAGESFFVQPVVIYTTSTCPYCHAAKALLRRKGASIEEISVDGDRAARMAMANARFRYVAPGRPLPFEDNTFATSFYTAGGGPFGGLCNAYISGNVPQQFTLQFF